MVIEPTEKDKECIFLARQIAKFCEKEGDEPPLCACMGPACGRLNCGMFWSMVLRRPEVIRYLFNHYYTKASEELYRSKRER